MGRLCLQLDFAVVGIFPHPTAAAYLFLVKTVCGGVASLQCPYFACRLSMMLFDWLWGGATDALCCTAEFFFF